MRNLLGGVVLLLAAIVPGPAADVGGQSCSPVAVDAAGERIWVLCEESRLFVTDDYAMSWTARPLPADYRPRTVKFLDARRGLVAGDNGMLLATDDGGYNWKPVSLPTRNNLSAIAWHGESGWIAGHGGVIVHTGDGGRTWTEQDYPTGQFYHVTTDNAFPYRVCSGQQESGSACVSSRGNYGAISIRDWLPVGVDEYGYVAPDPLNPDIVYGGRVTRYDYLAYGDPGAAQLVSVTDADLKVTRYAWNRFGQLLSVTGPGTSGAPGPTRSWTIDPATGLSRVPPNLVGGYLTSLGNLLAQD